MARKNAGTRANSPNRPLPTRWFEKFENLKNSLDVERLKTDRQTKGKPELKGLEETLSAFNEAFMNFLKAIPKDFKFEIQRSESIASHFPVGCKVRVNEKWALLYPTLKKNQTLTITGITAIGEPLPRYFAATDANVVPPLSHLERV